ncbi:MAG: FkbM family methyltransferase [Acidobacteriota bacterium]
MKPVRLSVARMLAGYAPPLLAARAGQVYPLDRGWTDAYQFRLRARTGSVYLGNTRDVHAHAFAIHGYFDWRLLAAARYFCRPGDTIVEVGANVGTETIGFADIVGRAGRVYAFEPMPSNVEQLRRILTGARLSQVEVVEAAVSDQPGYVTFVPGSERESGSGYISSDEGLRGDGSLKVECVTLDALFAARKPIQLLVIDAEGAEVSILRGGRELVRRDQPVVLLEAQDHHLRRNGFSLSALAAELQAHHYHIYELSRLGLAKVRSDGTREPSARRTFFDTPAGWGRNWLAFPARHADQAASVHSHLVRCGLLPCIRGINPLAKRFV